MFSWTFTVNILSDYFCRLIESSLGNIATKFNFFIHNLAQLRFTGLPSNDEPILSFSPKTYSFRQDGRIKEVSVFTYHKKYNPDKHYVSLVFCICCPFYSLCWLCYKVSSICSFHISTYDPKINKCIWSIHNCFWYLFLGKFASKSWDKWYSSFQGQNWKGSTFYLQFVLNFKGKACSL